jgi:hypothetical protein
MADQLHHTGGMAYFKNKFLTSKFLQNHILGLFEIVNLKNKSMKKNLIYWPIAFALILFASCKKHDQVCKDNTYNPVVSPFNFTKSIQLTNPYFSFQPGKKYIYEGGTSDGVERIEIERRPTTKVVNDITCVVIRDRVYIADKLVEDTDDWFAQDNSGNVWYMGEYVTDYNPDGSVKDHAGSWEAGVDCAKPGYQMLANPQPGNAYRQEYAVGIAEDKAEVIEVGLTVTVPFGTFTNCIKIKETSDIIPDLFEYKFYAPGVGFIKAVNVTDEEEVVLIDIQ